MAETTNTPRVVVRNRSQVIYDLKGGKAVFGVAKFVDTSTFTGETKTLKNGREAEVVQRSSEHVGDEYSETVELEGNNFIPSSQPLSVAQFAQSAVNIGRTRNAIARKVPVIAAAVEMARENGENVADPSALLTTTLALNMQSAYRVRRVKGL